MQENNLTGIITEFNTIATYFTEQLSMACPNSIISDNKGYVKQMIDGEADKLIGLFVLYILPNKEQIDAGNEDYFMTDKFSSTITGTDSGMITQAFQFKSIWKDLDANNRALVKQYMQALCEKALEYFIYMDTHHPEKFGGK